MNDLWNWILGALGLSNSEGAGPGEAGTNEYGGYSDPFG